MRGYGELRIFTQDEIKLWEQATLAVGSLPEDLKVRCHELARAVHTYLKPMAPTTEVVDGKFGIADHSWLVVATTHRRFVILDVYSVGSLPMVQLVDMGSVAVRLARSYGEGSPRNDVDEKTVQSLVLQMTRAFKR